MSTAQFERDGSVGLGLPPRHREMAFVRHSTLPLEILLSGTLRQDHGRGDGIRSTAAAGFSTHYFTFEPSRNGQLAAISARSPRGRAAPCRSRIRSATSSSSTTISTPICTLDAQICQGFEIGAQIRADRDHHCQRGRPRRSCRSSARSNTALPRSAAEALVQKVRASRNALSPGTSWSRRRWPKPNSSADHPERPKRRPIAR